MFLLICKLYICIQSVFGRIFYRSRLHLYWQFWQFEVQKLAYMLILAAGGSSPYLSSVPPLMTAIWATWSSFFGSRNSRFESQFKTKNTIYQGGRSCAGARVAPAEKFGLGRKF